MSSTKQSAEREFAQENADKQFSDKVQDRLSASATDCYLVSADGTRYPVHKTKLHEQSKVLRQARKHTRWTTTAGCDALAVIS